MAARRGRQSEITIQQKVHLFLRLYAELKKEPYSQGGEISISFKFGGPGESIVTNTQRQEFRSYLVLFRQLISPDDNVYLESILRLLPRHVDDPDLRGRLGVAMDRWKAANGIPSPLAVLSLGEFAAGRETARLYLYGGVFHSDLRLSGIWDVIGEDQQRFVEYQFRQYEGRVRDVVIEVKKVIDDAREAKVLRDQPLDFGATSPTWYDRVSHYGGQTALLTCSVVTWDSTIRRWPVAALARLLPRPQVLSPRPNSHAVPGTAARS
jgi:hypothetical protein